MAERGENILWVCCCWIVMQFEKKNEKKKRFVLGLGVLIFVGFLYWWPKFRGDLFGFGF
jgi:hypothetical protein